MEVVPGVRSLAATLKRMSAHLDLLAGQIFDVEEALGGMLLDDTHIEGGSLQRLQALDFTRQSLEDCALLLLILGKENHSSNLEVETGALAGQLRLASTRLLLCESEAEVYEHNCGEVDFF